MNKKGNMFMGIMVFIFIYFAGILFLPYLMDETTTTRSDLDCTNISITDGTKLQCLIVDINVPYYLWLLISIAIAFITSRM